MPAFGVSFKFRVERVWVDGKYIWFLDYSLSSKPNEWVNLRSGTFNYCINELNVTRMYNEYCMSCAARGFDTPITLDDYRKMFDDEDTKTN